MRLAYAQHVYKAQGLTVDRAFVLTVGWQTDRERAYVALTRARESTEVFVSRDDLGEEGLDDGAIERLGERMAESHAQAASVSREECPVRDRASEKEAVQTIDSTATTIDGPSQSPASLRRAARARAGTRRAAERSHRPSRCQPRHARARAGDAPSRRRPTARATRRSATASAGESEAPVRESEAVGCCASRASVKRSSSTIGPSWRARAASLDGMPATALG